MSDDDRELARDRRLVALRWLGVGKEDLRVARLCLDAAEPSCVAAAYHCQQAAEKLLKGLLVLADVAFAKTHDLERLGTLVVEHYPRQKDLFEATYLFTSWAVDFRYPGVDAEVPDEPSEVELRGAMATIESLVRFFATCVTEAPDR